MTYIVDILSLLVRIKLSIAVSPRVAYKKMRGVTGFIYRRWLFNPLASMGADLFLKLGGGLQYNKRLWPSEGHEGNHGSYEQQDTSVGACAYPAKWNFVLLR